MCLSDLRTLPSLSYLKPLPVTRFLSRQSRFPLFLHADRKALVLNEDRHLKSGNGRGRRILVLSFFCRTVPKITDLQLL